MQVYSTKVKTFFFRFKRNLFKEEFLSIVRLKSRLERLSLVPFNWVSAVVVQCCSQGKSLIVKMCAFVTNCNKENLLFNLRCWCICSCSGRRRNSSRTISVVMMMMVTMMMSCFSTKICFRE